MSDDIPKFKSYIWHQPSGFCFFVSTIERDSSAATIPARRFNETIAWEYDWDTKDRGRIVAQEGCGSAIDQHCEVCRQLAATGEYSEVD